MVQDVIVTVAALAALVAVAWPMWRRRARGDAAGCPNCAAGESCAPAREPRPSTPGVQPLTFIGGRPGALTPASKSSGRR